MQNKPRHSEARSDTKTLSAFSARFFKRRISVSKLKKAKKFADTIIMKRRLPSNVMHEEVTV